MNKVPLHLTDGVGKSEQEQVFVNDFGMRSVAVPNPPPLPSNGDVPGWMRRSFVDDAIEPKPVSPSLCVLFVFLIGCVGGWVAHMALRVLLG